MDFEVLFIAASSEARRGGPSPLPEGSEYRYSIGYAGSYEGVPKSESASFVWNALNRLRPEVVIISGYSDVAAWTAWLWAEVHRTSRIIWAESNVFDHVRHAWKELPKRLFLSRCDRAHVYGTSSREYMEKLGMPRERIGTRRALVDTALFLGGEGTPGAKAGAIRLIYCGRLSPEKNLTTLLRAFAALGQKNESPRMILKLVGNGPQADSLRKLVDDLGLGDTVEFTGSVQQTALPPIFRDSDVFVLPSKSEPWGLVVNEAMLSGLPVAVSDRCGCVADLVKPETGWTFSPDKEAELTRLLGRIADTPREILEDMGRAGRSLASEYSTENCAKGVVAMVDSLIHVPNGEAFATGERN